MDNIAVKIFSGIGPQLHEATVKGYRGGLAAMVKRNKKTILRLSEIGSQRSDVIQRYADSSLFKISYSGIDERLLKNFEVESFTVAGVMQYEAEEKLKAMAKSLLNGTHPLLQDNPEQDVKNIWRDEAYSILADYVDVPDMPPPSALQTNLRTATVSSYHAAEWQRLQSLNDIYTAYRYKTREDNRVREAHAALDNKVFQWNDPIWNTIWPPNGWNCRCYVDPLAEDELGAVPEADRVRLEDTSARAGLVVAAGVQKDFNRNSGKVESIWGKWLESKMKNINFPVVTKQMQSYADELSLPQEVWGEFIKEGKTVKITIMRDGKNIVVSVDGKETTDTIDNIGKYRNGILMNS